MMRQWQKLTLQLAVVLVSAFVVVYGLVILDGFGRDNWLPNRRVVLTASFTSVIFTAVVAEFRRSWRDWHLWLAIAALFGLHVLACTLLWTLNVGWPVIAYGAVALAEIPLLCLILDTFGFSPSARVTPKRR